MSHIRLIAERWPGVGRVLDNLLMHPELWDQHTARTAPEASPHHGLSDIWARFAAPGVDGSQPHTSVWYPSADLLGLRSIVYPLMSLVQGDQLGGVLITKIPAGRMCRPHSDPGWHARYYQKFGIQLAANEKQSFCFEDSRLVTKPGDVFWFDNANTHWVPNPSDEDRITAIVCIKTDKEF